MKNTQYIVLLLSLLLSLASCVKKDDKKKERKPDDILSRQEMVDIMVDMYIVESANNMRIIERDTNNPSYGDFFVEVMQKHNFKMEDYERSLAYYTERPDILNAIYDETLQKLTQMESEAGVVRSPDEEF